MSTKNKWLTLLVVAVMLGTQLIVSAIPASAAAPTIDWQKYKGTELSIILNKHPYSESLIGLLPDFEKATGMTVKYEILAEEEYFQKLRLALSTNTGQYDAFMTGPMLEWEYTAGNWLEPLEPFLNDPTKTDQAAYNAADFYPALMAANRWNKVVGSGIGEGHQWAIPVMVETYIIPYRADLYTKYGLKPPVTLPDMSAGAVVMREKEGGEFYGVVTRGLRTMATVATGFLSTMGSYKKTEYADLQVVDGKFKAALNQPSLVEATGLWVDMIKKAGPPGWTTVTWYDGKELFASGKYGMYPDCDFFAASYENPKTSQVVGKVGYVVSASAPGGTPSSAIWTWALAMSSASKKKDAAWYLIQYATSPEALKIGTVKFSNYNPTRKSVFDSPEVQAVFATWGGGSYTKAVGENLAKYARLSWTPQPDVFNLGDRWSQALHEIWSGNKTPQQALDDCAADVEKMLENDSIVPGPLPEK